MKKKPSTIWVHQGLKTILIFALTTASALLVSLAGLGKESIIMVFLLGVLFTTVLTSGYHYGIITSFTSLMVFNFLFTEPRFTFVIYSHNDIILLFFFLITAVVSGVVTSRLQQQMELAAKNELTAKTLYKIASGFLAVSGKKNIVRKGIFYLHKYTGFQCRVVLRDTAPAEVEDSDLNSYEPSQTYPVKGSGGELGTMQVYSNGLEQDEQSGLIIQAVATQMGIALESDSLYNEQEKARLAMESERLRATLLRSVAHDLRNPLTALLGAGNLLADNYEHLTDLQRKNLASDISEEIIWLTNLVENILDMTRINDAQLVIKKEYEVVDDVVSEAVSHVDRLLRDRSFHVILPKDVVMVPMDGRLIVRVLINLLENAVLHTPKDAAIELTVVERDHELEIAVSDTGEGIDEDVKKILFERFVTHDKTVTDGKRGVGLGLSNCKALIEAHGGTIRVADNPPRGSRFIFTLPKGE